MLVVRPAEFDRKNEIRIPLPRYQQVALDSEAPYHGGYHAGPQSRYAVIVSVESGPCSSAGSTASSRHRRPRQVAGGLPPVPGAGTRQLLAQFGGELAD